MDAFKDFLNQYTEIPEEDWLLIKKEFRQTNFRKNELLLEEGSICRHFFFFKRGLIRFFCNIDGEDITKTFCIAPYCFTSKVSFRNQSPSQEGIQALEDCTAWAITFEQYKKLEEINSWNIFMRKLINEIQEFTEIRLLESKVLTAAQNYENLLHRYPGHLIQKIPLKHLASFLGVAPQSLSRIRSQLHNKRRS